jgi:hypothetical protein
MATFSPASFWTAIPTNRKPIIPTSRFPTIMPRNAASHVQVNMSEIVSTVRWLSDFPPRRFLAQ